MSNIRTPKESDEMGFALLRNGFRFVTKPISPSYEMGFTLSEHISYVQSVVLPLRTHHTHTRGGAK